MRSTALLLLLVVPSATLRAQAPARGDAAQRELTAAFTGLIDALQSRDTAALSKVYAKGYRFAIGAGDSVTTLTREERLASVAASQDSISRLNVERCDFTLHGTTTAVGGCWLRQLGEGGVWTGIFITTTFRRATPQRRWQLLASHASVNRPRPRP